MDFQKLKSLINANVVLDIEHADEHELRVNYKPGDDLCWIEFTPEKYKTEEELAAVINIETERKLHGKINTTV